MNRSWISNIVHPTLVRAALALLTIARVALGPQPLQAATITVNDSGDDTTAGDGECTLREAIANVNAVGDTTGGDCAAGTGTGDTVVFDLPLPATITLTTSTQLLISTNVTISGPSSGTLAVDGSHARVFEIMAGDVRFANLTIENGNPGLDALRTSDNGGGILVDGGASVTLTGSTLSGNYAPDGGGIAISSGGTATLTNCTLSDNSANVFGGGISVASGGSVTLTDCTLSGNSESKLFVGGGGIGISSFGTAMLTNCTLSGNSASAGGGIFNGGTLTVTNSTLSGNYAVNGGGIAISSGGTATLTNCTLSGNTGSGIVNYRSDDEGIATLTNTIVANSLNGGNCAGAIVDGGHNLSSDDTCFSSPDSLNADPRLAPLANYGGPTEMLALCTAVGIPDPSCSGLSPAIDTGDDAVTIPPLSLTTDQRGLPRTSGLHVDTGAYEVQAAACPGDCDGDYVVAVNELVRGVNISLETTPVDQCTAMDTNNDEKVMVNELVQAVDRLLHGCQRPLSGGG